MGRAREGKRQTAGNDWAVPHTCPARCGHTGSKRASAAFLKRSRCQTCDPRCPVGFRKLAVARHYAFPLLNRAGNCVVYGHSGVSASATHVRISGSPIRSRTVRLFIVRALPGGGINARSAGHRPSGAIPTGCKNGLTICAASAAGRLCDGSPAIQSLRWATSLLALRAAPAGTTAMGSGVGGSGNTPRWRNG